MKNLMYKNATKDIENVKMQSKKLKEKQEEKQKQFETKKKQNKESIKK